MSLNRTAARACAGSTHTHKTCFCRNFAPPEEPPQPPETPVGHSEASAPAGSDSDVAAAALSAGGVVMLPLDAQIRGIAAQQFGDAKHRINGGRNEAAAGPVNAWRDDDLWGASARLPRLIVRNGGAWGADSPMMAPAQLTPHLDAPVRPRHTLDTRLLCVQRPSACNSVLAKLTIMSSYGGRPADVFCALPLPLTSPVRNVVPRTLYHPLMSPYHAAQDCEEWDAERQLSALQRRRSTGTADGRVGRRRASAPSLNRPRRHGATF